MKISGDMGFPRNNPAGNGPWGLMLDYWNELKSARDDLETELSQNPPNWNKIKEDLEKMLSATQSMQETAKKHNLHVARDPKFLEELGSASSDIEKMMQSANEEDEKGMKKPLAQVNIYIAVFFRDIGAG